MLKKFTFMLSLIIGLVLMGNSPVFAGGSYANELEMLKKRIDELEKKIATGDKEREEIKETSREFESIKEAFGHLSFGVGITGVVQGTANNEDNLPEEGNVIDGSYSVDIEIEADLEKWGTAFIHLEAGDGDSVSDEVEALGGVNADALGESNDLEVAEAWWEFSLFDEYLTLTLGKLDPVGYYDANEAANDETSQFLSDIFVNSIAVEWPDYTPGIRMLLIPNDFVQINLGIISSGSDWEDLFEDIFGIGVINIKPAFVERAGNYRFYGWVNGIDHVEWKNWNQGEGANERAYHDDEENSGFGLSFDQQICPNITLFCRFGIQDDDIAGESYDYKPISLLSEELEPFAIEKNWSIGGQVGGSFWGRPDDAIGIAFGQAIISDDYEGSLKAEGIDPEDESHFEIYYSFLLNDYIAISPDIQVIDCLGGNDDADTVTIFGVRCQISF